MIIGILCTAVSTAIASYTAFSAFESRVARVDALVNKHVKIETTSTYLAYENVRNIVLYNKYERRTWAAFEELCVRLCQSYIKENNIPDLYVNSMKDIEVDYLYQTQSLRVSFLYNNICTCLLKYVKRDMSWLSEPATLQVQQWLADVMTNRDNQIVLNAIDLIQLAADRPST